MNKNNNGITLIALIITIIVMLILVAVTINMAVNGGLFGYAGNAAKDTETAKQKELDWLNVDGMTTDQLISKYTSDPARDLECLRRVLPYEYGVKDIDNITPEEQAMYDVFEADRDSGELMDYEVFLSDSDWYTIWKYHNVYYKGVITYVNDEPTSLTVEPYTPNEIDFFYELENFGRDLGGYEINNTIYGFYNYNNKTYKTITAWNNNELVSVTSIEDISSKTLILCTQNCIELEIANATTTWYQWATDPNDNNDLDLGYLQTGLTLKNLIQYANTQLDKSISYNKQNPIVISKNDFSKPRVVLCLTDANDWKLYKNNTTTICLSTDFITQGAIYFFDNIGSPK